MTDTGKRQIELVEIIQKGPAAQKAAVAELVALNMKYIHREAYRLSGEDEHEDLVSEGVSGLLEAVPLFDTSRGTAFLTYATPFIRKRMLLYLESLSAMKVTRYTRVHLDDDEARRARNALDLDDFRETIADINSAQGNEAYFRLEESEMTAAVRAAIERLPEREAAAVRSRYGIGGPRRSRESLASEYGVSIRMINKYLANGLKRLREDETLKAWSDSF